MVHKRKRMLVGVREHCMYGRVCGGNKATAGVCLSEEATQVT